LITLPLMSESAPLLPGREDADQSPNKARASTWFTKDRALRASLFALGLMWFLPFLVPLKAPPIASFHSEALAAALGLLALCVLPAVAARVELPRIALLPLAFIILIVLQLGLSRIPFHQTGLLASLYLLWAAALVILGGVLRRELGLARVVSTLAWFVLGGAMLSALIAWAQHIDSDALSSIMMTRSPDRVWANLGQSNQLADYLSLGLVCVGFLCASSRLRWRWAVPMILALVYVLSLTGSRASWFYLLGLVALSGAFWLRERTAANRRFLKVSLLALVALALLPWALNRIAPNTGEVSPTAVARMDPSVFAGEERPRIWRAAWSMFETAPLLGVGFRQFGWHHFELNGDAPPPRVIGFTDHAHNLFLQLLAEFGIAGLIVFCACIGLWVMSLLRQPRTLEHWWLWGFAWVLGVHSLLEYPLWYSFFLGIAAVVFGLGEAHTIKLRLVQQARMGRLLLVALVAAGTLVLGQLFRDYLLLENFLAFRYRYIHASPEVNLQAKTLLLEVHRGSLLAPYVELGLARTISIDPEHLQDKLVVNGRAMRLFPIEDVVYRHAMLLALGKADAAARRQWDLARASYPEEESRARLVLQRRVEDGLTDLQGLLDYVAPRGSQQRSIKEASSGVRTE
jgi:O-antigen ligase